MGERGTSSQVSIVFESHGWLEVEGKMKESSSWEEKEEVKSTSQRVSREDPALPFIKQGEQVTLIRWDKPGERSGGECA
jgi:hypothetical protein